MDCEAIQGRKKTDKKDPEKADIKEQKEQKGAHFRSIYDVQHKVEGKAKGKSKTGQKGKNNNHVLLIGLKEKEN